MTIAVPHVPELFSSLVSVFDSLTPPLIPLFNSPCSLERILEAERRLSLSFPNDLRDFLLCADGQDFPAQEAHPIFPVYRFESGDWSRKTSFTWFSSVDQIVEMTGYHREEYQELKHDAPFEVFGPATYHEDVIAFTGTENSDSLVIDLRPAAGGTVGQVVMVRTQPVQLAVLSPNLRTFLAEILAGYSNVRFKVVLGEYGPVWAED